jgi:hypothetical protein
MTRKEEKVFARIKADESRISEGCVLRSLPCLSVNSVGYLSPFPLHDLLLQLGITLCIFVFVGCVA